MKTFYILWTYMGNYNRIFPIQAENAKHAYELTTSYLGESFHKHATVYVFSSPPEEIVCRGESFGSNVAGFRYFDASEGKVRP